MRKRYSVVENSVLGKSFFESSTSPMVAVAASRMLRSVGYNVTPVERVKAGFIQIEKEIEPTLFNEEELYGSK